MAKGKLMLVSLGPGDLCYLPPAARTALTEAEVVIGYGVYLQLIAPLLDAARQRVVVSALGAEMERAGEALELARNGRIVALVSSGDIGVYAMAGPVFQQLARDGGPQDGPEIVVVPGISAVQAVAARLGAPIAHDFCCISLSDLLTPWELIERRVRAAAEADFVVAFYNPRSRERHWQLEAARAILLERRVASTPVAVARAVTRVDEQIQVTTLQELDVSAVDMFSLVLIGNSQTRQLGPWLATPRGYREER